MKFYAIPSNFNDEIDSFAEAIQSFQEQQLHPTKFRAIRVPFGIYEQRTKGNFMIRIRMTAGGITPGQLTKVAELARKFGNPSVHVTTRQELQLHDIQLDDIIEIIRELYSVGLSCRGGGGNTVRNIMASFDSGINPKESFDVTPHAVALCGRMIAEEDSWNFPRKFKISFSSTERDNALAAFNDLGFIATHQNGERGFRVFVAGGMGCRPRPAKILHDFIAENQLYHVCAAVKNLYLEYGNRKTKNSGRLRFLWEEMGETSFREKYTKELAKVADRDPLDLDFSSYENISTVSEERGIAPKYFPGTHFSKWQAQYVGDQQQAGLKSVSIPLHLGDIAAEDGIRLSRFLANFGENVMRLTMSQNIQVRNLPEKYLGNLYELVTEIDTLSHLPKLCGEIIACTGANTCTTGVCLPQGVVPVMQKFLLHSGVNFDSCKDVRINISGCPNSCGQHHIGDLGFYGRIVRKNGKSLPGYWVIGGASVDPDTRAFGEKCGWVAAKDLPQLLVDILLQYQRQAETGSTFKKYFDSGGKGEITALCTRYSDMVPDYAANESYYTDWGATEEFTTAHMGHGECSAGIYDMIEVAMNSIKESMAEKERAEKAGQGIDTRELALNFVSNAAGMLLVTRGIDPATESEMYLEYEKNFIDKGLVEEKFRPLVTAALRNDLSFLADNVELAEDLGRTMIQLYHGMDNRLRFKCEADASAGSLQDTEKQLGGPEIFKDLRGVACPMNFVKTKVELSRMHIGDSLIILLDDGEPIDNVPRSVVTEGHEIISRERKADHWQVVIEKKV
jgi:sulfite reductase (ferredoxin)